MLLAAARGVFAGCETLEPALVRELPAATFRDPDGVAWLSDGSLAIGSWSGVHEYELASNTFRPLVAPRELPHGLPQVEDLATDGRTLVAFNNDYSDLAFDLARSRIAAVHRGVEFQVLDLAVRGDTLVLLGFPAVSKAVKTGALWIGRIGAKRDTFRLLHQVDDEKLDSLRSCITPFGGATVVQQDGTIAMITAAEPGVHRFRPDGTPLPPLGHGLSELAVPRIHEFRSKYAPDVAGLYRELLNPQPMADDLIETSDGLAIVVRRWTKEQLWWELWFPGPGGGTRKRIRLAMEDQRGVGGHVRCAGRGNRVACLVPKALIPSGIGNERTSLMLFDLGKAKCSSR
jgi:hypothetical protein